MFERTKKINLLNVEEIVEISFAARHHQAVIFHSIWCNVIDDDTKPSCRTARVRLTLVVHGDIAIYAQS